jgi:hypothetical protein
MKLATYRNGTATAPGRRLADLTKAVIAETTIAGLRTLQQLLDDWQIRISRPSGFTPN